jgi:hypothetical protein
MYLSLLDSCFDTASGKMYQLRFFLKNNRWDGVMAYVAADPVVIAHLVKL